MHSWDSETGKRTTTVRTDNGFELVNDHGVLLRFRVDDDDGSRGMAALQRRQPTAADCEPPRYRWHLGCILLKTPAISLLTGAESLNTLGRRARRYIELAHEPESLAAAEEEEMESEALARAERYGVELEAQGEAVGGRSFDDALRVMQPSAQQKIATLTRELKSLRAGQRRRRAIEDPQVKLQVAMARQGTVRNRKRKKEERLVRAMVEQFHGVIETALATHAEMTPMRPIEETVAELGDMLSTLALASFPDVSAGLLASAVQKAILSAKEAAGMTDPKDALGGLGRVRVRAQHDYQPEKAMGARYTQLMTGEELMVTDIRHPEWWEGYRETSKDGQLDWDENATRAFFPRSFVEVVWCEALFTEAGPLGVQFVAAPNRRGRTCYCIHELKPGSAADVHASQDGVHHKLKIGMALDTVNGDAALGMSKEELMSALAVRPLLLSFVPTVDDLLDTSWQFAAKALYDYDGARNHGEGYLTVKRGQTLVVTSSGEEDWWEGYCTLLPHVRGLFPSAFVQLLADDDTERAVKSGADSVPTPKKDSGGGGEATGSEALDRDKILEGLWQLGVDRGTLDQVTASLRVAKGRQGGGQELLEDLAPREEWTGGSSLADSLDELEATELKAVVRRINIENPREAPLSTKGSKGDVIRRLEIHVAKNGGKQPELMQTMLKERLQAKQSAQAKLDAQAMAPGRLRTAGAAAALASIRAPAAAPPPGLTVDPEPEPELVLLPHANLQPQPEPEPTPEVIDAEAERRAREFSAAGSVTMPAKVLAAVDAVPPPTDTPPASPPGVTSPGRIRALSEAGRHATASAVTVFASGPNSLAASPEPEPPVPSGPTALEQRQMDSMGVTLEQLRQLHGSDAYDAYEDGDEKLLAAEAEDHFDVDAAPGGRGRTVRDSRINRAALALSMLCSTLLSASGLRASGHGKPPTGRRGVKTSEQ
eukprot:COSAG04_NODE_1100_length_8253_cov_31.916728_4_plen_941_part_00